VELTLVVAPVCEREATSILLSARLVRSIVTGSVWPGFNSVAVLFVVVPLSFIVGSICMRVATVALGLIVNPLAFVYISVSMVELALAISFVLTPLSFISRPVGPYLNTVAVAHFVEPLPGVSCSIFKRVRRPSNSAVLINLYVTRTLLEYFRIFE